MRSASRTASLVDCENMDFDITLATRTGVIRTDLDYACYFEQGITAHVEAVP